jgi:pilus assembly protein CpaB
MKNRTIIGIFCIILAVTVMFGISPIINKAASGKADIVRVKTDIPKGKQITAEDIENVTVGAFNLPLTVIKDKRKVIGKYTLCELKKDDTILTTKISDTADKADDIFRTLNGNEQVISITIDSFAGGLSGKLQNGDIVSVFVTLQSEKQAISPKEFKYVKVITTTTAKGNDSDNLKPDKDGNYPLPTTVTFLVNSVQASLLAGYEANEKIHLSLVYRGETENANKFLAAQNEVFQ